MARFYLNADKSIVANLNNDKLNLTSNHSNSKNAKRLISNISSIISTKKVKGVTTVLLNDAPFVSIAQDGKVSYNEQLTSFETRLFAQGKKVETLPFDRSQKITTKLTTDLHTHFAGALSSEQLIEIASGQGVFYTKDQLQKIQINTDYLEANDKNQVLLDDVILNTANREKLINAMKIDTSEQETFNRMEDIYSFRNPITKNPNLFMPMVEEIAKDCASSGVKYIELSLASVISNFGQLKQLAEKMPQIEKETGTQVRFLGAMWRHSDKEWNNDEVDRLKVMSKSPYVVGCDFMGHETNSTMEFYDNIKTMAKYAIENDPNFVIRVHAGENALFKANARQALLAIEEAHFELQQNSKKKLPYPQVRLGHGIYGFDEPAPWDEKDRTKNTSTLDLCKSLNAVIEFNMSSNLSLNNINSLNEIPIKKYLDNNIQVVLGTDGKGIYSTSIEQEKLLAKQAGLELEDFKKIEQTEKAIIKKASQRFKAYKSTKISNLEKEVESCYTNGTPQYNEEVSQKYRQSFVEMQERLKSLIVDSNAETNLEEINKVTEGKTPILITGSSAKHWPKISEENQEKVRNLFKVLAEVIDPETAYIITGGTNHGVEKQAHIIMNERNQKQENKLVVLGTLTEEAANMEFNSVEPDTITHAIIAQLNNRPAKKWFDLPDAVLNMVQQQNGAVLAVGGGPIVSDMIQRSHNLGLNLNIMDNIEGASADKAKALEGNDYSFNDALDLIKKIKSQNPNAIKKELSDENITEIVKEIYERKNVNMKKLKLVSLDPSKYPDKEIECYEVENMKEYAKAFIEHQAKKKIVPEVAKKTATVKARLGVVGEEVDTRPRVERDGNIYVIGETVGKIKVEGSMIVMNPDGEEYIVKPEAFGKKYAKTEEEGVYAPIAEPITYIELTQDIVFKAPWGEEMYGVKGAALNVSSLDDIYAIQNEAFKKTYTKVEELQEEV